MGRYDGEDYDDGPLCEPTKHNFARNGLCFRCGRTKAHLINYAKATLKALEYQPKKRSAYGPIGAKGLRPYKCSQRGARRGQGHDARGHL